ncbi:hypothetical protein ACGF12_05555 [Kitasatospora sp. NPDC048296]|uniref:hypothetical protein n=1 Tax=Kitasatospora sp. NPDC048296 TaxID=3364048 RepID=UPI0037218AF8
MDQELTSLAGVAAAAVVQQLTTSAWERIRSAIGELWRRRHPERAETVLAELGEAREEVAEARRAGDGQAEQEVVDLWGARLRRLLAADPGAAEQLRSLVEELTGSSAPAAAQPSVNFQAHASGRARINQAVGDIHVNER